jgi:PAS domain S-box
MNRKKEKDNGFKNYLSMKNKELEETAEDALKLHDKLLEMGFREIAKNVLKIHNDLKAGLDINKQTSLFLRDETGYIYGKVGVNRDSSESKQSKNEPSWDIRSKENVQKDIENYRLFLQNIRGSLGLWLDENLAPTFIDGAVEEITGYNKEDFQSKELKWIELVIPEDRSSVLEHIQWVKSNPNTYAETEYRIRRKDGKVRWLKEIIHVLPENHKSLGVFQSFVRDINEQKQAEEDRMRLEETHIREIHHRIKNNLQVILSLLDLKAESMAGENGYNTLQVIEAFKESRDRIASMALIYEELYKSNDTTSIDFSGYIRELISYLYNSYEGIKDNISLKLSLEQIRVGMDTAVSLGNITTELLSNALKHAFPDGLEGEISVFLGKRENYEKYFEKSKGIRTDSECQKMENLQFVLAIKDNGKGIPEAIDFENAESLGLQLVNLLVEQIDGCVELKRGNGTEFTIWFMI